MAVNFEYYKVFYYVAKYKKISLAADKLYVSQPAVTQIIQKLEEQLGGKLFTRTTKGIELTDVGENLYKLSNKNIENLENLEFKFEKYKNLNEGIIRIVTGNSTANAVLYDALEQFNKDYPNIKIELSTGEPRKSLDMLHSGKVDMVLTYLPLKNEYTNMESIEYKKMQYVFAMSKKYFEVNNVKISKIDDLNKYVLIVPNRNSSIGMKFFEKFKIKKFGYEVVQEKIKKELIIRNMGIGFISKDEIKKEIEDGEIIIIDNRNYVIESPVGAIVLNKKFNSYAINKFLEYMRKNNS